MGNSELFGISTIGYIIAMMTYITYLAFRKNGIGIAATVITVISFVSQTIAFILRWVESYEMGIGRAPLTNLYESLVFFVWCLILGYLIIEFKYKNRSFGAFVTPIAGVALGFIDLSGISKEIAPLVPALQSNWLLAHVTMSFIAYAGFGLSFATAMMYLITTTDKRTESAYVFWTISGGIFFMLLAAMGIDFIKFKILMNTEGDLIRNFLLKATFSSPSASISVISWLAAIALLIILWRYGFIFKKVITSFNLSSDILDELTYKTIAISFPIFTLGGLIFGAIWADQAWGVYWSWDPKETWSLITWIVYAVFLHARLLRGWKGKKSAVLSVIGFIAVIFTYLGVNLFLSGLHSYGELK